MAGVRVAQDLPLDFGNFVWHDGSVFESSGVGP